MFSKSLPIKSALSLVLALLLLLGSLPLQALAEENTGGPVLETLPLPEESPTSEADPTPEMMPDAEPTPLPEETPAPEEVPQPEETPVPEESPAPEEIPAPESSPEPVLPPAPEVIPEAERQPLPENTSRYVVPDDYDLTDIRSRLYWGEDLSFPQAMHRLEAELAEAINRIGVLVDTNDRLIRYNGGLEEVYRSHMPEIAAVFCARQDWDQPADLASRKLSAEEFNALHEIYWSMIRLAPICREDVFYSYGEEGQVVAHIYYCLQVDVNMSTALEQMPLPTVRQQTILETVLTQPVRTLVEELCSGELSYESRVAAVLGALPADLDPTRSAVVTAACSLVGQVPYYWGGKSDLLGWDDRWNVPRLITSDGSEELGEAKPYGLDCAGLVTWAFLNGAGTLDALDSIGHGTVNQFYNSRRIDAADALPGDLAFAFGEDGPNHVGIVVGGTADGELLICHCTSTADKNIVIDTASACGCYAVARPDAFYRSY